MPSLYPFSHFNAEAGRYYPATVLCCWLMLLNCRAPLFLYPQGTGLKPGCQQ